ncbi:unnamed protein product [Arabidopsis halleri]
MVNLKTKLLKVACRFVIIKAHTCGNTKTSNVGKIGETLKVREM